MKTLPAAIALTATGLGAWVLVQLVSPPPVVETRGPMTSQDCAECHPAVFAEWESSHHAMAYTNPEVRKLSNDFRNEECLACHTPRPVLDFEPGERVLARSADRGTGVDCLSCHQGPEGGMASATRTPSSSAPCQPYHESRMSSVQHCASCHNQHGTVDQWHAAPEHLKGENCNDCHMTETFREGGRRGKHHGFPAAHDRDALLLAVKVDGGFDEDGPWFSVENYGAAHNFPTDERSRAADIQVRWQDESGSWGDWENVWRFRDPYRDEVDLVNTQLPSGETWRQALPQPDGATIGEARLLYRTQPYLPDDESDELGRVTLER